MKLYQPVLGVRFSETQCSSADSIVSLSRQQDGPVKLLNRE